MQKTKKAGEYESSVNFSDLNDDCIWAIFSHLSLKQLLAVERVSSTFKKVINRRIEESITTLRTIDVLVLRLQCSHYYQGESIKDMISSNIFQQLGLELEKLSCLLDRCKNLRCLNLHRLKYDFKELYYIFQKCPNVDCLHLGKFIV